MSAAPLIVVAPVRDLAGEINAEHEAVRRFIWSALDHAHNCGDLLVEAKAQAGHGHWKDWLAENCPGFSGRTASAYMNISRNWDEIEALKRQHDADLSLSAALKHLGVPRQAHNTGDYEWFTPPEILDAAREVLGSIQLDPASTPRANEVVKAKRFFTIEDDALQQKWTGTVYMNPPFANGTVSEFCQKLTDSVRSGAVPAAIVLINNCTETRWFTALAREAAGLCFPVGRVAFWKPDRVITDTPLQGQALVYLGRHVDKFCSAFSRLGVVAEVRRDLARSERR